MRGKLGPNPGVPREPPSDRKMILFNLACLWTVEELLVDPRIKPLMVHVEEFADGRRSLQQMIEFGNQARQIRSGFFRQPNGTLKRQYVAISYAVRSLFPLSGGYRSSHIWPSRDTCRASGYLVQRGLTPHREDVRDAYNLLQADILRLMVPNPHARATIPGIMQWLDTDAARVHRIAREIYETKRWQDLPVLWDAMTDAGCEDMDIRATCMNPLNVHRGWWVLDALLGLE